MKEKSPLPADLLITGGLVVAIEDDIGRAANKADISTVIIEGQVVMRNRRLLALDEGELFATVREMAVGIGLRFDGRPEPQPT